MKNKTKTINIIRKKKTPTLSDFVVGNTNNRKGKFVDLVYYTFEKKYCSLKDVMEQEVKKLKNKNK